MLGRVQSIAKYSHARVCLSSGEHLNLKTHFKASDLSTTTVIAQVMHSFCGQPVDMWVLIIVIFRQ